MPTLVHETYGRVWTRMKLYSDKYNTINVNNAQHFSVIEIITITRRPAVARIADCIGCQ